MNTPLMRQEAASSSSNLLPPDRSMFASADTASNRMSTASNMSTRSYSEKFSLAANPREWGSVPLLMNTPEPDDYLHNPDPKRDLRNDMGGTICTARGFENLGCLAIIAASCLMLFAGFPLLSHFMAKHQSFQGGFNLGGVNASGQIPSMGNWGLIDLDTPQEALTKVSYMNPDDEWDLVFSDEFNQDGRTFYPGDDPYWEAPNLHYWQTNDLEWYDPSQATTKGGALRLKLEEVNPIDNHNLKYRSGMIQSWNKFCFTGGLIEAAVTLPGANNIVGLWPAVWTMGNLGRAGYGASLEGMWPYSYDTCDVGTLANQTHPGTKTPLAAVQGGDPSHDGALSGLPGQRLSACTCPGESHPGPMRKDGSYVGRSSPEIDIFEATIDGGVGKVSQSAQWAPFNAKYHWLNTTDNLIIPDPKSTKLNDYIGGAFQQTTSGLSVTDQNCYELGQGCFSVYGFEYAPGFDDAYISWITDSKVVWTMKGPGMGPDPASEIGPRVISQEPMYIIANLGFSLNFGGIDFDRLTLPATMSIDYIRVYQPRGSKNIGCDPPDYPTAAYIDTYIDAYTNSNYTGWGSDKGGYKQPMPKNKLLGDC
ncbi:glycoside hydrolase family 16 protein [Plicaturopsis crispa FD-325 SS-3]|uniref:Glycoside hydrolase family 16 protein n=1 Tax=Plicaturopsis crispa FD-325 SS-3 TaxID=944288 RepID=A0A0C9T6F9_PLICR|nr:glycoside hydrolase family 16 protein [Plicaturopsis crispa FD-325 SS-3]